jgi:hypothetical protein
LPSPFGISPCAEVEALSVVTSVGAASSSSLIASAAPDLWLVAWAVGVRASDSRASLPWQTVLALDP